MKNILLLFYLCTLSVSVFAQVPDTTFGIPQSLYPGFNDHYAVTACDFEGRRDQAFSALHLPDGRIVLAGNSEGADGNDIAIARLLPNGEYDQSLGQDGQLRLHPMEGRDTCLTAVLYGENRMLLAGGIASADSNLYQLLLLRTNLEGAPDTTFGNGGLVTIELPSVRELVTELRVLPDGRIIVAGNALGPGDNPEGTVGAEAFVGRLLENGTVDTSFGSGGFLYRHWENTCETALLSDLSMDGQGRIVIIGAVYDFLIGSYSGFDWCFNQIVVCRYTPDGQVDSTFGTDGSVVLNIGGRGSALLHYEDGRIFLAGVSGIDGNSEPIFTYCARLLPDGSMDTSFNGTGELRSLALMFNDFDSGVPEPFGALRLPGRIVIGSLTGIDHAHAGFGALALTEDGRIDSTFATDGIFSFFEDTAPRVYMNEITSTAPDNFFLSGYYRSLLNSNMLIGKVLVSPPSGTNESGINYGRLRVYPNPIVAGQNVVTDIKGAISGTRKNRQLVVKDLYGRAVFQRSCPEQTDMVILGTSILPPGLYTIEFSDTSSVYVGRLIVVER